MLHKVLKLTCAKLLNKQHHHCHQAREFMLHQLTDLNFEESLARKTLMQVGPDIERAVNWILDIQFEDAKKQNQDTEMDCEYGG